MYFLPQPISMALLPSATKWPYQLNPRVGMITHNFHPTFRICKYTFIAPKSLLSAVSGLLALRPYLIVDFSTSLQNQIVVVSKSSIPRSPTKGRLDSARLLTVLSIALAISPYLIWRKQKCLVLTLCVRTRQCISLYNQENSCQNVSVVASPARYTTSLGRKVIRLHRVILNNKYNLLKKSIKEE